ncbi:MAG: serine/threonine-protein kinase [Bryobacteraceae bacterium]
MERVGRYEILGELGRGAMGVVLRAMDPVIGRTIAIKTIRFDTLADSSDQQRLRDRLFREARSAGGLSHPHIVTIYDIGQEGDIAFIAMEYVAGSTLDAVMRDPDRLDRQMVTNVLSDSASALDYAHARGIIHRDIKPGNVMVTDAGSVKITDFGVAKITSHQVTRTEMVLGTPSYMSPEQIEGSKGIDGRSDQFSLAVMAYELLTGEKPFAADSLPALLFKLAREDAPSAHLVNPTLNEDVDLVLRRAMAKKAADRFDTCSEFITELNEALIGCPNWAPLTHGVARDLPTMGPSGASATPRTGTGAGTGAPWAEAPGQALQSGTLSGAEETPTRTLHVGQMPAAASGSMAGTRGGTMDSTGAEPFSSRRRAEHIEEPERSGIAKAAGIGVLAGLLAIGAGAAAHFSGMYRLDGLLASLGLGEASEPVSGPIPPPPAQTEEAKPAPSEPPPAATETPVATTSPAIEAPPATPAPTATTPRTGGAFPVPAGPPEPKSAMVDITSTPAGARVSVDDTQEGCTTPCAMELAAGRHVLRYNLAGHRPGVAVILVPQETKATTRLDMASGTLLAISTPPGARVFVDGEARGTTPASLKLSAGKHKIEMKLAGYPDHSREIDIRDEQILNLEVTWPGSQ